MKGGTMKKIIVALLLIALLSGCATGRVSSSGRFLQVTIPMNDAVGCQITFPNERSCRLHLDAMRENENRDLFKCSDISMSSSLPYRAVIRDTALNYIFEIETVTYGSCAASVEGGIKDSKRQIEIVTACEEKTR
jgi:hypothetical protein